MKINAIGINVGISSHYFIETADIFNPSALMIAIPSMKKWTVHHCHIEPVVGGNLEVRKPDIKFLNQQDRVFFIG